MSGPSGPIPTVDLAAGPSSGRPSSGGPARPTSPAARRRWLAVGLVSALVGGVVGAGVSTAWPHQGGETTNVNFSNNTGLLPRLGDPQAILASVLPAVVSIDTTQASAAGPTRSSPGGTSPFGGAPFGGNFSEGAGTGMVITPGGVVLTNNHVIAGATSISVTFYGQTRAMPAKVLGTDPVDDVALVQVEGVNHLHTVALGDSGRIRLGDSVLAVGNALALPGGPSVTEGIISGLNRQLSASDVGASSSEELAGLIQTDAAINPGNSGGPLVDASAQVIGMSTAVAASTPDNAPAQNVGFAIATDRIKPLIGELEHAGAQVGNAYMGVLVATVTPQLRRAEGLGPSSGAAVVGVDASAPAAKAGVRKGDVIVAFDGRPIATAEALTAAVRAQRPGQRVVLRVIRVLASGAGRARSTLALSISLALAARASPVAG